MSVVRNSGVHMVREATQVFFIQEEIYVDIGAGAFEIPVYQVIGGVLIRDQQLQITEVIALSDLTDVWADAWDGTVSDAITKGGPGGAVLSGAPANTVVTKTGTELAAFTVILGDQVRVNEPGGPQLGEPFTVNQKAGVDTFIRLRGVAGAPVNFRGNIKVQWSPIDGGELRFLGT